MHARGGNRPSNGPTLIRTLYTLSSWTLLPLLRHYHASKLTACTLCVLYIHCFLIPASLRLHILFVHINWFVAQTQYTPLPTRGVVLNRVIFHGSVVRSGQILIRSKLSVLLILIMSSEATCILLRLIVLAQDIRLIWYVACSDDSSQHVNTCRAAVG